MRHPTIKITEEEQKPKAKKATIRFAEEEDTKPKREGMVQHFAMSCKTQNFIGESLLD